LWLKVSEETKAERLAALEAAHKEAEEATEEEA